METFKARWEELSTQFKDAWERSLAQLEQQVWYQQLQSKWEGLEPEQRLYVRLGVVTGTILGVLFWTLSFFYSVQQSKSQLSQKLELLAQIQSASDELQQLRATTRAGFSGDSGAQPNWPSLIQGAATTAGLPADAVEVPPERPGPAAAQGSLFRESLITVRIKHVNLKQLTQLVFQLETLSQPIKLRSQTVDAMDAEGYVNGELLLSGFSAVPESTATSGGKSK